MKKLLQRWLAMVLAVLMVMGTLPTSAWAARITDDVVGENPVLDQNDPVADTQGRYDDSEQGENPVDPIDPDGPPADLGNININNVEVNTTAINKTGSVFATGTSADSNDTDSVEILILPLFTTRPNVSATAWITTKMQAGGSYGADAFAGDFHYNSTETAMANCDALKAVRQQSLPYAYFKTTTRTDVQTSKVTITWGDWVVEVENATAEKMTAGDPGQLNEAKLSKYVEDLKASGGNLYLTGSADPLDTSTSLPFMIFMGGSSGFSGARLDLPVAGSHLKVEIETKDAVTKTAFQYRQTAESISSVKRGDQQYSKVTLSNSGSSDLTVRVTIARDKVTSIDPGDSYGNKADMTDNTDTIRAILTAAGEGLTPPTNANNGTFTMQELYGLLANWEGEVRTDGTVPGGSNAATANTLEITVPHGGSTVIYVAGTRGMTGAIATAENLKWANGLAGFKKGTTPVLNYWSSYRITATDTIDPSITASDTAGIRWMDKPTTRPKVQLVHIDNTGAEEIIMPDNDEGSIINSQYSQTAPETTKKKHTVQVSGKTMVWIPGGNYYALDDKLDTATDALTVSIGQGIYVDGIRTSKVTLANADEIIKVPMYAVSVTDDPPGKAEDVLGSYMWDETVDTAGVTWKKVSYKYYPEKTTVGVYAKKDGFASWTGATPGSHSVTVGGVSTPLENTGAAAVVTPGYLTVNADANVVANYVKPISLVTTFGGDAPGDNMMGGDKGNRSLDNVFSIEVLKSGAIIASAYRQADGTYDLTKITEQTTTNAWLLELDADTYTLKINGRAVSGGIDAIDPPTVTGTNYNYVVELTGVTPQVKNTTNAGSTLVLPDDTNPARTLPEGTTTVTVSGSQPNTGENPTTLYYPKGVSIPVSGAIASGDAFSALHYNGTGEANEVPTTVDTDAGTWKPSATNVTLTHSETAPLVASFEPAALPVTVTVNLDGTASHTPIGSKKVELRKTDAADGSKDIELVKQTGTGEDGLYKKDVEPGTYKILVNDKDTGVTVTVAAPSASATLNYYNVEVKTDGHGAAKVEATSKTDLVGSAATFVETSSTTGAKLIVFDGTAVKWTYGDPAANYEPKGWDTTASSAAITLASVSGTTTNTHTANFQKKLAPLTIHVRKSNATTDFTGYTKNIVLTTSSTSATTNPVTLTKGNAYTFSHAGLEAGQTYYIWAVTNATGSTYKMVESFTVPDSKDAISKDVIYYTLTVAADTSVDAGATAGVAHGTTTPTDGNNTSVVVLSGEKATVKAFPSNTTKFSWLKWESSDKDTLAAPTDQSATVTTVEADITLTAYFQRDKYDTYLQIKLNGSVLAPADVGTAKDVTGAPTLGSYTVSYDTDKKAWKATVPVSDTTTKWSVGAVTSQSFSKAMVNGTDGSVQTLELFSLSLSVATASTGLGAVSPANKMVYEKNTNVSIAATPTNSDYKWTSWTVTKGDDPAAATKTFAITKETELAANFAKKTGTVTVKVMLDGTTPVNDATVVLNGTTFSGTAPTDGVYTFTNVEYNEHGTDYTLTVSKTGYIGTSTQSVTVNQATTAATQVNFYTVDVSTNGNGTATMKVGSEDTVTASTTTAVEKVALAGTKVVWTVGTPAANHSFSYWDNEETGSKETTITVNSLGAKTGHKAFFLKDRFNATLDLKLNDSAVGAFNTDIISITVSRKSGDKPFTPKSLTAEDDYDATNKVWKVEGLPSGNTYTWTVTTLGNKTFTADTGSGAVDPDQQSISLYSLITSVASGQSTWGTATPNTRGIFKSGTSVTVTATPSTNYKFDEWTATKGDKPTTASATFNIAKETELVASFARKTSDVTVTILLDGEADSYTGDTVPYHVTLATSSITGTQGTGGNKHVYTFKDVPHNEGGTAYTLTVTRDGYYGTYTQANITVKDGSTNDFTVNYYTAKAKTAGANAAAARGDAKLSAGSGESTVTATTGYKNTTTPTIEASIVVLSGTSVTWEAYNPADNYSFAYWDGTSGEKNATHAWTVNAKGVEHTAFFTKNAYNTYLDLTVNGEKWGTKGASDKNIKNVQLVTAINGTTPVADVTVGYNETGKLWEAKGIASNTTNAQPYWRVTTVDDGVYYTKASIADKTTDATVAAATVTETLFGIAIEDGAGNGTGNKPTLKAQTASTAAARIVTRANTTATVALNKKTGYTFSDWAMKKGLAPAVGDTDATGLGDGNATGYTLDTNYAAPATAPTDGDLDLHIMPVYTYEVTVHTKHGEDFVATTVTAKENGGTSTGTITRDVDGKYTVSGLLPTKEYSITVNDFESNVDIDEDDIGTPVVVNMYQITVNRAYHKPSSGTPNGTAQVQVKTDAYANTSRYLPQGANTDTTNTVNVKAAAGTNERLTHSVTYATEVDVALWSMAPTDKGVSIATGDINEGNPAVTVANLSGDVTITAHFVLQYNVTVVVSNGTATTPTSTAAFTGKQSSASTIKDPATGALVDATTYVKAKFTKGTGETLTGWTISADGGTLYSDADLAEGHKITDPSTHTGEEVYFVPAKEGATLTANVEAAKYTVMVTANLDNAAKTDATVELHYTEGGTEKVAAMTYNETDKVYKSNDELPFNTTYTIWTNIATQTTTTESAIKTIRFTAAQAEADTNLSEEVNYYTINLAVDPDSSGTVDFGTLSGGSHTTPPANTAGTTAKMIVLAKSTTQTIDIRSAPYVNEAGGVRYRFDTWTATKRSNAGDALEIGSFEKGGTPAKIYQSGAYTLPKESDLKTYTDTIDGPTKQLTLTATMKRQWKVTLELPNYLSKASSNVIVGGTSSSGNESVSAWVDDGASVSINASTNETLYTATQSSSSIPAFNQWVRTEGDGTFTTADATDATKGTKMSDAFAPKANSTIRLELWKRGDIQGVWTYDKADPTKSSAQAGGSGVVGQLKWTANGGQAPTQLVVTADGETTLTLVKDTHYVELTTDGKVTGYRLKDHTDGASDYLGTLTPGKTYTVTATYILGDTTSGSNQYTAQTETTTFVIEATLQKLTKVDIQVEDGTQPTNPDTDIHGSATANVNVEARDAVRYEDHTVTNVKKAELRYQWYYADKPITRANNTVFENDAEGTTNPKTAKQKGEAFLNALDASYKLQAITVADAKADTLSIADNTAVKGKYIFALVWVDDNSDTAQGAVITNSILVDFDADISVYEDGEDADHLVKAAQADNYTVYLWDADNEGTFDPGDEKAIPASHSTADNHYHTGLSKLTAGNTYHVYVQEVENDTNHYLRLGGNTPVTITRTSNAADVYYYTVTTEAVSTAAGAKNGITNATTKSGNAGEDFSGGTPTFSAATGNNTDIPNGEGVLKGSTVKATAKALTDKTVGWEQDYDLTWMNKNTSAGNYADVSGATKVQNSTTAVSTGHTHTGNLTSTLFISGRLEQKVYKLVGVIRDVNNRGSIATPNGGQLKEDATTLTIGEGASAVTYTGVFGARGGFNNTVVTFTVPRGTYTLTSDVMSGSTHKGYYKGNDTATTPAHVPATPQDKLVLDELTAQTANGATVADRFTIYVAKTELAARLKDKDKAEHDTGKIVGENTQRTTHSVKTDDGAKVVFNYDEFTKTVTVTNEGNTPLTLTPSLKRKGLTAADTAFGPVDFANGTSDKLTEDGDLLPTSADKTNGVKFEYTTTGEDNSVTVVGPLTTEPFDLAPGESKEITITIPATLENDDKGDVTYRLDFDAKDGRDRTTQGPVVGYNLNIDIDPVTVYHVGTKQNDDGSYTAQYTWIKEDSTDITSTANANGQSYQKLKKPVTTDADRAPDLTNDDLIYSWYVASWDAVVSLDANGNPTGGDVAPGQGDVSTNGLTYTPKDTEYGKALYLVVKGQNNAKGAAMTPDRTKDEEPVPVPYAGKVEIWHNDTKQPATGNDAPEGYAVYLWDKKNTGDFNLNDAIATTWDSTGNYFATKITDLWPGEDYAVYTNIVRGQTTKASDFAALTGVSIDETHQNVVKAVYREVKVANTTVTQSGYDADLGKVESAKSNYFFQTADGTTIKATPAEKPSAGVAGFDGVDVANDWVRTGTTVTFTYPKWTKDYNLSWTGGVTATGNNADKPNTENISHTATYSSQLDEVKTSLDLNLYNVSAHVVGSVGHVGYIDMTLTDKVGEDAGKTYTFTTKNGVADKIWGTKNVDWNDNIKISQTAVFHLPNAIDYVVNGMNKVDSAAEFAGYSYNGTDYDYVKPEEGTAEANKTINVTVNGPTEYDVRLKGDGLAMRVKGNVPASLDQKNLVDPATTSVGGQATILPAGSPDRTPAGSAANDTVYLNYNYKKDLTVIVTASNESKQGEDAIASTLKEVTFAANAFDSNKFAVAENKFETGKDLGRTGTSSADWKGESDTVTLTIKQGLAVGTHTFSGTFTFKDNGTPQVQNTVTYTLTVIVEPLEFTAVSIDEKAGVSNGTLTITDYTVTRKAEAGDPATPTLTTKDTPAATATDADEKTALKQTPDYGYQWIRTAPGVTVPNVASVSASGALTSSGTANYTEIPGATGKEYTPVTADEGQNLYLVIYGTDDAAGTRHNATGFAVSPAQVNTYQGIVYINVDGVRIGVGAVDNTDPGYTVEFIANDAAQTKTGSKWEIVEGGNYGYVSETGLTPGLEYTVKVSRAKDDTTTVALTKKLTGTKIGKTIALTGTPDTNNFTNVTQADYFTVTAVKLTPKAFNDSPSTAETFTGEIIPTLTIGTGANAAELTNKTPVLSGQSVKATIANAWTQDYTLTWQMDNADGADDSFTDANNTSYVQDAADAVATGYPHGTVAAKTFIGGRLDQNTYTIVGTIDGKTYPGDVQQVKNVTLKSDQNVTYYSDGTISGAIKNGMWKDGADATDNKHNHNDTVTFTVVKGTYTITGFEDTGYTIRKVTVSGGTTGGSARNVNALATDVKELTQAQRTFVIHLEPAGPQLKVTDTETPAHTATSDKLDDHQFADNNDGALYVYKTLTADDVFTLNLHNPGNVDLTLKDPEVYKVKTGTDYSTSAKLQTALGNAAVSTKETLTNHGWTDVDGTRTIVTIAGLPAANADVKIGAGETGSGVNAVPAGSITVNQNVYNKDDAIYVVKFASEYLTTDGAPAVNGPTVYYVLNLKVEPLPLKKLDIERVGTSDKLRLIGFDSTDSTNKTGLDNVKVDADGKADTTELATAKDKALTTPGDISFVWVKAPADMERDDVVDALSLDKTNNEMLSSHADVKVTTVTDREHTPVAADQGLNFYLVAFRTNADSNADDFAVSNLMYAQVTVSMEAHRSKNSSGAAQNAPGTTSPLLTDVHIKTGDTPLMSNTDKLVVTADGETHRFTADLTDVTAAGNTDNPVAAKWYFIDWAANLTGSGADVDDADHLKDVTTDGVVDRLLKDYEVTGQATVIGYFDLLPQITKDFGAYNVGSDSPGKGDSAEAKGVRTIRYVPNDGSGAGQVQIWIESLANANGDNLGFATSDGSVDLAPRNLGGYAGNFDSKPAQNGAEGDYILKHDTLTGMLMPNGKYRITFFDLGKGVYSAITAGTDAVTGTQRDDGYAGYDRYFEFVVQQGEKAVTAQVFADNFTENNKHVVNIKNTADTPATDTSDTTDRTAGPINTFNGEVLLTATPADGYLFDHWQIATGNDGKPLGSGAFGSNGADAQKQTEAKFTAYSDTTVEAVFRKVAYTTTPGHAKIHYGTKSFLANSDEHPDYYKDLDITTADTATTVLTYEWLTGADLTAYLTETTANGGAGLSAADAAALVAKTAVAKYTTDGGTTTGWLDWNGTTHKFEVKAAAKGVNVEKKTEDGALKDVGNELVVYVKVTETNSEQEFVIPFTIDIMTSELKIRTDGTNASSGGDGHTQDDDQRTDDGSAYKTKYIAENGADNTKVFTDEDSGAKYIINGNAIELDKFEFISIDNVNDDSNEDKLIGPADSGKHNAGEDLDGENNPTSIVNGKGKWIITVPTNGLLNGSGNQTPENANLYTFQFVYTGVDEGDDKAADDYNYTSPTISLNIPVQRPARSLKFADEVTNNADLKKGTAYSEVEEPAGYDVTDDTVTAAPTKLAYTDNTYRTNEGITYLDKEPEYTVKLQRTGNLKDITLTIDPKNAEGEAEASVGFVLVDKDGNEIALDNAAALKTLLDTAAGALNADGTETALKLKLAPVHDNVWVGKHYIRFKLEGTDDLNAKVTAYYTLSIDVAPKVITKLDVTVTDPETEPTKVEGTTDDKKVNDKDEDDKGNVPITDVTVTWGPEENKPDGKNTEVKVDVKIDPNYVYAEDDPTTPDDNEDIEHKTDLTVAEHGTPKPADVNRDETDEKHIVHITQKIPYLMHDDAKEDGSDPKGPAINHSRTVAVAPSTTAEQLGKYTINLGAYGGNVYDVQWTVEDAATSKLIGNGEGSLGATLGTLPTGFDLTGDGAKQSVELDLTTITGTLAAGSTYSFTLKAIGKANDVTDEEEEPSIISLYTFTLRVSNPPTPGGGGSVEPCPCKVLYHIGLHGTTTDATIEDVSENNRPVKVPAVTALDGYVFRGWSLSNPATLKKGEKPVLVDPKTVDVKGESMIFYAVIVERPFHEHYVIGYPNGNFGPADDIDRASVATIIARAILPDFKEGANYGNPGKYTDVSGHWAESAIAYCSKFGVFEGYTDGTFKPNQPITRQEFALVIARLDGVMTPGEMDFTDIDEAGPWALGGIYTAYEKGWVNGYTDGTFKPLNNIRRDEAVKVFNAYLNRGVDADGLAKLHEYVHSGVASNVTGNGTDEYMTWPDVPQDHWAYYEIVEAANDHEYEPDFESELGYTLPETWDKCWIDERWRYHDDINDGGPNAALVSAGFRVWLH